VGSWCYANIPVLERRKTCGQGCWCSEGAAAGSNNQACNYWCLKGHMNKPFSNSSWFAFCYLSQFTWFQYGLEFRIFRTWLDMWIKSLCGSTWNTFANEQLTCISKEIAFMKLFSFVCSSYSCYYCPGNYGYLLMLNLKQNFKCEMPSIAKSSWFW